MVKEKFVIPNWKYARIPGVKKSGPAGLETTFKVRSYFSGVPSEDGDQIEEPIEDGHPAESQNDESDEEGQGHEKPKKIKKKGAFHEKIGKYIHKKKKNITELLLEHPELGEDSAFSFKSSSAPPEIQKLIAELPVQKKGILPTHPKTPK